MSSSILTDTPEKEKDTNVTKMTTKKSIKELTKKFNKDTGPETDVSESDSNDDI